MPPTLRQACCEGNLTPLPIRWRRLSSQLPFDFGDLRNEISEFVAVKFGNLGDSMNVLEKVLRRPQQR